MSNNLADESPQAQKYKKPKAVAKDEKQEETDALAAQRRAIQSETSSNLADESPQAQEVQEAKKKQLLKMKNKRNRCTCSTTSSNSIRNIK